MSFTPTSLFPLIAKLGEYLGTVFDHCVDMRAAGLEIDADLAGVWLSGQMSDWDPHIKGKSILDDTTRTAAARFLSGVAFSLISKEG